MKISPIAMIALVYMFLLELGSLAIFAYWGSQLNLLAAIGIPLVIWVLWSLFLAPKASMPHIPYQIRTIFKFAVFALASFALYDGGHKMLATFVLVTSFIDVAIIMLMKLDIRVPKNGLIVPTNSR